MMNAAKKKKKGLNKHIKLHYSTYRLWGVAAWLQNISHSMLNLSGKLMCYSIFACSRWLVMNK